jgi:hypothetical protein
MNIHWKRTMMVMMMMMCPGIGRTTISHSVSIVVRMYPGSARRMRLQ